MTEADIRLRPVTDADRPFLREVYASTREAELELTGWGKEQRDAFVGMQFEAQRADYAHRHPGARHDLILVDGEAAGRLYVDRTATSILVIDIALLPAWRRRGVATALLSSLTAEARAGGRTLQLHVERFNPARALYERLGLRVVEEGPVYLRMEHGGGCHDPMTPDEERPEPPATT